MVAISQERLGGAGGVVEGDMKQLEHVKAGTCAAVLSFFALHHVDVDGMRAAFAEWHRVLRPDGQLLVATWEGDGPLDYGEHSGVIALRYREATVCDAARSTGFRVDGCEVKPVDGMPMDALYLTATR
jgi:ubiquinone/menaquinone biosynthesis C-methylase UbiE